jgi:hypothetical protein
VLDDDKAPEDHKAALYSARLVLVVLASLFFVTLAAFAACVWALWPV